MDGVTLLGLISSHGGDARHGAVTLGGFIEMIFDKILGSNMCLLDYSCADPMQDIAYLADL